MAYSRGYDGHDVPSPATDLTIALDIALKRTHEDIHNFPTMQDPLPSHVVAYLVPTSDTAKQAIKLRPNRLRWSHAGRHAGLQAHSARQVIAKLDLGFFLGRRCIAFGSTRSVEFRLPKVAGVCDVHLLMFLDLQQSRLRIRDISGPLGNTKIETCSGRQELIPRQATYLIDQDCRISIGKGENVICFLLHFGNLLQQARVLQPALPSKSTCAVS